jgi:putative addiction module component (TIGR02574 family)
VDRETAEILERAIRLPEEARAALADSLLESLDTGVDEDAEETWRDEIQRRLAEIDSGSVQLTPWSEARKKLEACLKK